jgi:hypothetical protein
LTILRKVVANFEWFIVLEESLTTSPALSLSCYDVVFLDEHNIFLVLRKQRLTNTYSIVGECVVAAITDETSLASPRVRDDRIQDPNGKLWHIIQLSIKDIAMELRMSVYEHEAKVLWNFTGGFGTLLSHLHPDNPLEAGQQSSIKFSAVWKIITNYKFWNYNLHKLSESEAIDWNSTHTIEKGNDILRTLAFLGKEEIAKLIRGLLNIHDQFIAIKGMDIWLYWLKLEQVVEREEAKLSTPEESTPSLFSQGLANDLGARGVGLCFVHLIRIPTT